MQLGWSQESPMNWIFEINRGTDWRSHRFLPRNQVNGWSIWQRGVVHETTPEKLLHEPLRKIAKSGTLVAQPGGERYLPAGCFSLIQDRIIQALSRQVVMLSIITLVMLLVVVVILMTPGAHPSRELKYVGAILMIPLIRIVDFYFALKQPDYLAERALFVAWLHKHREGIYIWGGLAVIIGCGQLILLHVWGG